MRKGRNKILRDKKIYCIFLVVILFIFSSDFTSSQSSESIGLGWGCSKALGEDYKIQCVEADGWVWDEDKDGNVSLELSITNKYDYAIKNITLDIEKCSGEIKLDTIKSSEFHENAVLIKIDDVCVYEGDYFYSNSSFTYFDENDTLKSYNGTFRFSVAQMSLSDFRKRELIEERVFTFIRVAIPLAGLFIILFIIKRFIKKFKK